MNHRFSKEEALRLHREMWRDMQKELGDCPDWSDRIYFKRKWVKEHRKEHGYGYITNDCFLCEYAIKCAYCPIDWSELTPNPDSTRFGFCTYNTDSPKFGFYTYLIKGNEVWGVAPISKILALPERKVEE